MTIQDKDLFHVHTYRCGHADNIPDEEYIRKAIALGASGIWFTDHAPFPGNPFGNRMKYSELPEYINTLKTLKGKYAEKIQVHIGLEIEYFPSYDKSGYYRQLKDDPDIEILLLGQHMAETDDSYTFAWTKERLNEEEFKALGDAEIMGIQSGYFQAVAHPDRIFRRQKIWTEDMQKMADQIITAAKEYNVALEQNESSKRHKHHYWNEFWIQAGTVIHGLDAHFLDELKLV